MERIETGKRLAMFALVVIVSVTVVSLIASRTRVSAATFPATQCIAPPPTPAELFDKLLLSIGAKVTITNSTLSGNSVEIGPGGGIANDGELKIGNRTCSNNSANGAGGAILNEANGSAAVTATINNCTVNAPGTTATHALLPDSVAIDAVADCTDIAGNAVTTDQRGVNRPVDGDNNGSAICDAGAYEFLECTLACPPDQTANTGPGATDCCTVVNYPPPTFDPTCGEVDCSPPSGSCYPVGVTLVTCGTVQDGPSCTFTVTVTDTTPPAITCPSNVSSVMSSSCPPTAGQAVVNYPPPVVSDNCSMVTLSCSPASGSSFPPGVSTVTCTAKDAANNTATCSFTVSVFSGSLQDDSDSNRVVLFDIATGSYSFCCNGTVFTGKGTVSLRGCTFALQHNAPDRRVSINADFSAKRGTASIQSPPGVIKCTISDRDLANNTRTCP